MAKISGLAQRGFVGGYDLSGDIATITRCASPRPTFEVPGINRSAQERLLGLGDGEISFTTWFNDAALQEHVALKGLPTADVQVIWAMGATIGASAAGLIAKQINYDPTREANGALSIAVQCLANAQPLEWGVLLTAGKRADTAATNGTSLDNAASSASGAAGYVQVFAFTGTSVTIIIQESSDDGVGDPFATSISFTAATGITSERKTVTGTVERYLRVATTGTFTVADFVVMVRRGTAQDVTAY